MTVNYNLDVATSSSWAIVRLLTRWRGSIWKAVIWEYLAWITLYMTISVIYRFVLSHELAVKFESLAGFIRDRMDYIPLNFVLGFFVTIVVNRWSTIFDNIGLIDQLALTVQTHMRGTNERARLLRRSVIRHMVLAQVLVFRDISLDVRRRFPTLDTVVAAGFMLPAERAVWDETQIRFSKYWLPVSWALDTLVAARQEGFIASDYLLDRCCEEVKKFRSGLATCTNYDWISSCRIDTIGQLRLQVPIPLIYPQLVSLSCHVYFILSLISRQFILGLSDNTVAFKAKMDIWFPFMTSLQFVIYIGWMKIAQALLNPLGDDDDDFPTNFIVDRNITVGMSAVDSSWGRKPALEKDMFWEDIVVEPLYSEEASTRPLHPLEGSTAAVQLGHTHVDAV